MRGKTIKPSIYCLWRLIEVQLMLSTIVYCYQKEGVVPLKPPPQLGGLISHIPHHYNYTIAGYDFVCVCVGGGGGLY